MIKPHIHLKLMEKVEVQKNGCWNWTGSKDQTGYGHFMLNGKCMRAHRASWILAKGRCIPKGKVLRHKCDNHACVNPNHLVPGSHGQNLKEAYTRGRRHKPSGHLNPNRKVSQSTVEYIRRQRDQGDTYLVLSMRTGLSVTQISRIVRRKAWK